jgi:hypothetical protein
MSDLIISPAARSALTALASMQDQIGANKLASGQHTNVPTSYVLPAGLVGRASAIGALTNMAHAPDADIFSTTANAASETGADLHPVTTGTLNEGADASAANDPATDSATVLAQQTRQQLAAISMSLTTGANAAWRLRGF